MGGYSAAETTTEIREILNQYLPLTADDQRFLLFDKYGSGEQTSTPHNSTMSGR